MLRPIACAVAMIPLSTAVDAAVYRYDVTMSLDSLRVLNLTTFADNREAVLVDGLNCRESGFEEEVVCDGSGDFTQNRFGLDFLERYTPTISGSLLLDSQFESTGYGNFGMTPQCTGSAFLCRYVGDPDTFYSGFSATDSGFSLNPRNFDFYELNEFSDSGITYENDGHYTFELNDVPYTNTGSGLRALYTTTSLNITEIAPVPLPAGTLLLPSALALLAWRRRRAA